MKLVKFKWNHFFIYTSYFIQKESKIQQNKANNINNNNTNIKELQKNEILRFEPKESKSKAKQLIDLQYKEYDSSTHVKHEEMRNNDTVISRKKFFWYVFYFFGTSN